VVGFPRIRPGIAAGIDVDAFYRILFEEHATIVGPGHWFEQPRTYFRLGYGWPTLDELREGLSALDAAVEAARR
jgi:DNA-binding transcriptional MocR family regulator